MVQYHSDGMIKKILGSLIIISIFLAMFLSNIGADQEVTFPDKNLEEVIREEIEKSTGPIYESDLKEITELLAGSRNIKNIKGLEYCKNLKVLDLSRNYISDISPLSNLINLKELILEVNNISDISPLSDLTNLIYLYLSQNYISDISPLSNLINLYILYLDYNPLNSESVNTYIPELEKRVVRVRWEPTRETYRSPTTPPATTPSATTSVSAQFEIIDLRVIPENPRIGDTLNILVDVRNTGNSLESYTVLVTIGEESMTENIELEGKSSKTVSFHKVITEETNIKIRAGDLTKTLTILPRETSPSTNKLRYFVVVIVAIVAFLVMYFLDKKSKEIILSKIRLIAQKKRVIGALIISIIVAGGVYFFWPMFVDRSSESFEFKAFSEDTMSTALPVPTEFSPTTSTPSYTTTPAITTLPPTTIPPITPISGTGNIDPKDVVLTEDEMLPEYTLYEEHYMKESDRANWQFDHGWERGYFRQFTDGTAYISIRCSIYPPFNIQDVYTYIEEDPEACIYMEGKQRKDFKFVPIPNIGNDSFAFEFMGLYENHWHNYHYLYFRKHNILIRIYGSHETSWDDIIEIARRIAKKIPDKLQWQEEGNYIRNFEWKYEEYKWTWEVTISKSMYNYYHQMERFPQREIAKYVLKDKSGIIEYIIEKLKEAADEKHFSESERVYFLIAFVQSLPYHPDNVSTGHDEWPKFPIETLADGGGDCEDTSILVAALLHEWNYGVVLLDLPSHMAVGFWCTSCHGTYYRYKERKYYYLETTGEGWKIGDIPPEYENSSAKIYKV